MAGVHQNQLPGLEDPLKINLDRRNAFGRVPFPAYFGIDPEVFDVVTEEAYAQSEPKILNKSIYRRTEASMFAPDRRIGWVVLNAAEYALIPDYPEALARRVQARQSAQREPFVREQEVRRASASRAGGHALKPRVVRMENLLHNYNYRVKDLRELQKRIPLHWRAHTNEGNMREIADTMRGSTQEALRAVADVDGWSQDDLRLALHGLDKRLLAGRGQQRMSEKKDAWLSLTKLVGNYTLAKRLILMDRLARALAEIDRRLPEE